MVAKGFDVVYSDFSGGHFIGRIGTQQPANTYDGPNVGVCQTDGTLLPLKAFYDATGAISGNTAANTSRPFLDPASGRIVWAGDTTAYAITNVGSAPPLGISTAAVTVAVLPNSLPAAFNGQVVFPASVTNNIVRLTASTMTPTTTAVGFLPNVLCSYGNFLMAATATNRVYFSNPGTAATWTIATDFFDVGDPGTVIAGMCVHQGSLMIATSIGMWALTGIPGQTASLRQLTTVPFTEPFSIDSSIVRSFGVYGAAVSELAGTTQRSLNYGLAPDGRPALLAGAGGGRFNTAMAFAYSDIGSVTDEGGVVTDLGSTMWVLDFYNGQWVRRQVTTAPVRMGSGQSTYAHLFYRSGSPDAESMWLAPAYANDLVSNSDGSPATGTAKLAEHFEKYPFRVKEILCEVDYGSRQTVFDTAGGAAAYAAANRSISVMVATPSTPIEASVDLSLARATSSTMSQTLPQVTVAGANYTRRRNFVRFAPTDGTDTYVAQPVVTLTGVKLRRLILRCEWAS